jgi:hypothetical protein
LLEARGMERRDARGACDRPRLLLVRKCHVEQVVHRGHTWNGALSKEFDHWGTLSMCCGGPENFGREHLEGRDGQNVPTRMMGL